MGKGLVISGISFIGVGFVIVIVSIILTSVAFQSTSSTTTMLTNDDFSGRDVNEFIASFDEADAGSSILVHIKPRTAISSKVDLTLQYSDGDEIFSEELFLPIKRDIEVPRSGLFTISSFELIIKVLDQNITIYDLDIKVTTESPTDKGMAGCCGATVLFPLSGLFLLIGVILLIVGLVKGKKKEVPKREQAYTRQTQSPPPLSPPPQYHRTQEPVLRSPIQKQEEMVPRYAPEPSEMSGGYHHANDPRDQGPEIERY